MHQASILPKAVPIFSPPSLNFQFNSSKPMVAMKIRCFCRHFSLSAQRLRAVPLPLPKETHLWYLVPEEVKSASLLNQYMEILSPSEKQSVLSLREDEQRKRALLARILVRTTIARYQTNAYIDARSLQFKKNAYGKPEVDWKHATDWSPPPLHFNISHTSSLIACGITSYSPIGIDVEEKTRKLKNNVMSFARRFFCQHEVQYLANILDPEVQRLELLKLWTLKEAYVKALGRGFSAAPFKTFRIHIGPSADRSLDIPEYADSEFRVSEIALESSHSPNSQCQFALLELADTHFAAICTENSPSSSKDKISPMALKVWKTVPFLEDLCMSRTGSVISIGGFVKQVN